MATLTATLTGPSPRISARAALAPAGVAELTGPSPIARLAAGHHISARGVSPGLNASGTVTTVLNARITGPAAVVIASGKGGSTGEARLTTTSPFTVRARMGAVARVSAAASLLRASTAAGATGVLKAEGPGPLLRASATQHSFGSAILVGPMLRPVPSGSAVITGPAPRITSSSLTVAPTTYEAYATNLRYDRENERERVVERGGNEVTRYTSYPFERIIRFRDSYYGITPAGMYLLEGETDDGVPIQWALRTGTTDFDMPTKKNPAYAYVGGRLGPAAEFTVLTGEKSDNSYTYTTPRGQTAQNYRQIFGRGLDARYYAFAIAGDGEFEVDDLTFEVTPRTRRI